jgi:hypothetical protein
VPIVLHRPLDTYHSPGPLQLTYAHTPFYIRREHLILEPSDRLLESLALALEASVTVNLRAERTITDIPEGLVDVIMSHVVGVEESENVSRNEGRGYVHINYGCGMNLTVVSGAVERQPPFYKRVRGVEMGLDVTRRRFTAVLVADAECYGRLAVVSDVDDGGFALNVDKELRGSAMLYRSKYNGAMLGSRWS